MIWWIHLLLLPLFGWMVVRVRRGPVLRRLGEAALGTWLFATYALASAVVTLDVGPVFFGLLQALSWLLFLYAPLLLLIGAGASSGATRWAAALLGMVLAGIGIDAVFIEPFNLQVRRTTIEVPGLREPLRIALLADIQTRAITDYERAAFQIVAQAEPDLVLFAGDYIQTEAPAAVARERARLAQLIQSLDLIPQWGAHAVEGDVDRAGWQDAFDATIVQPALEPIEIRSLGPVELVLLDLDTSRDPLETLLPTRSDAELTILLGHRPDFSLGLEEAGPSTLMLAGHTHGGQVQLPGVGPLITFSNVVRERAHGQSVLAGGASLVVSAGIGLERSTAPRLRFLCPPEVWLLDVVPKP